MSPIMACAVLLTGASSLRVAPSMVLQPRRDLLAGGAAAAASTLLVPEALAKKPLCLPGTNPAKALGGPGYTIGILEHDTPSFAKWHKVLEGFGSDLLSAYPPECKVIDEFFIKTTAGKPNGQDAVLAGLVPPPRRSRCRLASTPSSPRRRRRDTEEVMFTTGLRDERPQGREEIPGRGQERDLSTGPQGRLAHR